MLLATQEADSAGQRYVRNEHILLALAQANTSYAAQLLKEKGLSTHKLRLHIKTFPHDKPATRGPAEPAPAELTEPRTDQLWPRSTTYSEPIPTIRTSPATGTSLSKSMANRKSP